MIKFFKFEYKNQKCYINIEQISSVVELENGQVEVTIIGSSLADCFRMPYDYGLRLLKELGLD